MHTTNSLLLLQAIRMHSLPSSSLLLCMLSLDDDGRNVCATWLRSHPQVQFLPHKAKIDGQVPCDSCCTQEPFGSGPSPSPPLHITAGVCGDTSFFAFSLVGENLGRARARNTEECLTTEYIRSTNNRTTTELLLITTTTDLTECLITVLHSSIPTRILPCRNIGLGREGEGRLPGSGRGRRGRECVRVP